MSDPAFALLRPALQHASGDCLWLADENLLNAQLPANPAVSALCNRVDLHHALQKQGWRSQFNDFDFSAIADASLDLVVYRVSKEKPVVHHIINQACRVLKPGGILQLAGEKGEGIKSYIDKASKLFDGQCEASKADKNYWYAVLTRPTAPNDALDDSDYPHIRPSAEDSGFTFSSKPGLFGWNKIDKGSAFLIEQLPAMLAETQLPAATNMADDHIHCLDLGCGYGYLSLHLQSVLSNDGMKCYTVATDNNAAAIACCQQNFSRYGINGKVVASDCAQGIEEQFNLAICNPPFHSGFNVENSLTDRFLAATAQHLHPQGVACFVVNKHIALERKASQYFGQIELYADNGHFKLIRLRQPRVG